MKEIKLFIGLLLIDGKPELEKRLTSQEEVEEFLMNYLQPEFSEISSEDVAIIDVLEDKPIFLAKSGNDIYSFLNEYGISLPDIYANLKKKNIKGLLALDENPPEIIDTIDQEYGPIGFSTEEVVMRTETFRRARLAQNVKDVSELIKDTYFDALFTEEEGSRSWGYFDEDLSVSPINSDKNVRIYLKPESRVKFTYGGEDVLSFIIFDPPE
ncbi:MAG: hypothetical protein C4539_00945 [Ignavibacteriales bacterium]|nr:MAG: hypothetical protein C4539_00945 [Ignavibacteriales bacterium]